MSSARSLYRLAIALAVVGTSALLVATALAFTAVAFEAPTFQTLLDACRDALVPALSWHAGAVVLLTTLTAVVATRALRAVVRQIIELRRFTERLRIIEPLDMCGIRVLLVDDERAQAFCAGLIRPRVYLSTGALVKLEDAELEAVLAHERHHLRRRDPLRLLVARAVAEALFFLPVLRQLSQRYTALAELAADEAAVAAVGSPSVLASALLSFGEQSKPAVVVGIAPERVDHLLGEPARWNLPGLRMIVNAVMAVAALIATGAAVAAADRAAMTLPFVFAQMCAVAIIAIPAVVLAATLASRWRAFAAHPV